MRVVCKTCGCILSLDEVEISITEGLCVHCFKQLVLSEPNWAEYPDHEITALSTNKD
jgi:hypothetical protein